MIKIIQANAIENYLLELKFEDGTQGTLDYSRLVGQGVFSIWNDLDTFKRVSIGSDGRYLFWNEDVDLCADALYLEVTGKKPKDIFPQIA